MLTETLAQYSALMVLSRTQGWAQARRLLRYELDDYLWETGFAGSEETLVDVADQRHIAYLKGRLAMNVLASELGERKVNQVLARFFMDHRRHGPPYAAAVDLVSRFKEAAPDRAALISDLFERVTVYDNRLVAVRCARAGTGYEVTLDLESHKFRIDADGGEKEAALDDWVDVCLFGEDGRELCASRVHLTKASSRVTMVAGSKPKKAAVDPYVTLIDRRPENNVLLQ